jgi:hypothetical protein
MGSQAKRVPALLVGCSGRAPLPPIIKEAAQHFKFKTWEKL